MGWWRKYKRGPQFFMAAVFSNFTSHFNWKDTTMRRVWNVTNGFERFFLLLIGRREHRWTTIPFTLTRNISGFARISGLHKLLELELTLRTMSLKNWRAHFILMNVNTYILCIMRISMYDPFSAPQTRNTVSWIRDCCQLSVTIFNPLAEIDGKYFTDEYSLGF